LLFHTAGSTALDQNYYGRRIFGKAVAKVNIAIREANARLPKGAEHAAELPARRFLCPRCAPKIGGNAVTSVNAPQLIVLERLPTVGWRCAESWVGQGPS
jgi:hypothetical protein